MELYSRPTEYRCSDVVTVLDIKDLWCTFTDPLTSAPELYKNAIHVCCKHLRGWTDHINPVG